jgi:hypothetical protein
MLDRLDCTARGCLCRGHAGRRQRLHGYQETVRQRDLVRLRSLREVNHGDVSLLLLIVVARC